MSTQPKWTKEREDELTSIVGTESPVSLETVASASEQLGNSTRSISAKLRKMGYEVDRVTDAPKAFSEAEEAELVSFVNANPNTYTYKEIAEKVFGDVDLHKKVQGKLLHLEMTEYVKKAEPKEAVRTYSESEEAVIVKMANAGEYLEDIASALGKEIKSVRGKVLSMLKTHGIVFPKQKNKKEKEDADVFASLDNIEEMTVSEIAKAIDKTERGVKVMLTHRAIKVADYDGEKRHAKNAEKRESA